MLSKTNHKPTRTLILVMLVLVVVAILIAKSYYSNVNSGVDPRIKPARLAYNEYNDLAVQGDYLGVLKTLDTIELIYSQQPHYENSYEIGVAHINRSALYLTIGLHIDSLRVNHDLGFMQNLTKKGLLDLAENELIQGIEYYEDWDSVYGDLAVDDIDPFIREEFLIGMQQYDAEAQQKFIDARVDEIETAQWENDRRLSVAYTNLGIVYFNRDNFDKAANLFKTALDLWAENLNAENNLNSMLGKPMVKRNFIQKMFPKERKEIESSK